MGRSKASLRDASYRGAKRLGHGEGYKYAHDSEDGWVDQDYLGVDKIYYEPTEEGYEIRIKERLDRIREMRRQGREARKQGGDAGS